MPTGAVVFLGVKGGGSFAAESILLVCYSFKMVRVKAMPLAAEVVDFQTL